MLPSPIPPSPGRDTESKPMGKWTIRMLPGRSVSQCPLPHVPVGQGHTTPSPHKTGLDYWLHVPAGWLIGWDLLIRSQFSCIATAWIIARHEPDKVITVDPHFLPRYIPIQFANKHRACEEHFWIRLVAAKRFLLERMQLFPPLWGEGALEKEHAWLRMHRRSKGTTPPCAPPPSTTTAGLAYGQLDSTILSLR